MGCIPAMHPLIAIVMSTEEDGALRKVAAEALFKILEKIVKSYNSEEISPENRDAIYLILDATKDFLPTLELRSRYAVYAQRYFLSSE
jgi:hypothetical protein